MKHHTLISFIVFFLMLYQFCNNPLLAKEPKHKKTNSVERNFLGGVQIGFPYGLSVFHEQIIAGNLSLKADFIYSVGFSSSGGNTELYFTPGFSVQPRWYYNLDKRKMGGKNISGLSSNYLAVNNKFTIKEGFDTYQLFLGWGMRRKIHGAFHFEMGAGIFKQFYLNNSYEMDTEPFFPYIQVTLGLRIY